MKRRPLTKDEIMIAIEELRKRGFTLVSEPVLVYTGGYSKNTYRADCNHVNNSKGNVFWFAKMRREPS
jgi:hypothetical protein